MFQRCGAADPAAVIPRFLPGIHTLDHHHGIEFLRVDIALYQTRFQFFLGHDGLTGAIAIGTGCGFVAAGCQNGGTVLNRFNGSITAFNGCIEIAHVTESGRNFCLQVDMHKRVLFRRLNDLMKIWLQRKPLNGLLQPEQVPSQSVALLYKVHRITVIRDCQGCMHPGDAATDDQGPSGDRQRGCG